jgi:hypothetical protein
MDKKQKQLEKIAIDFAKTGERRINRRWAKKFIRAQRNGCPPGQAFDFKTDKCRIKSAMYLEAYFGDHDVKALDKFGRIVDVKKDDIKTVARYLLQSHIVTKEQIDSMNMILPIGEFPTLARNMLKRLKEYKNAERRM